MPAPIQTSNVAFMYFPGAFDVASGTATLFISGSENNTSGVMPLFLNAKETYSSTLSLFLNSTAKTNIWNSLGNPWESYNISCTTGAPNYCQDWEYIPYYAGAATGLSATMTLFESSVYRGYASGAMPLYIANSGAGVSFGSIPIYLFAQNLESQVSGNITLAVSGHDRSYGSITLVSVGAYANTSGIITLACPAYELSTETLKLFISGI